jgi:hypothetical protein
MISYSNTIFVTFPFGVCLHFGPPVAIVEQAGFMGVLRCICATRAIGQGICHRGQLCAFHHVGSVSFELSLRFASIFSHYLAILDDIKSFSQRDFNISSQFFHYIDFGTKSVLDNLKPVNLLDHGYLLLELMIAGQFGEVDFMELARNI